MFPAVPHLVKLLSAYTMEHYATKSIDEPTACCRRMEMQTDMLSEEGRYQMICGTSGDKTREFTVSTNKHLWSWITKLITENWGNRRKEKKEGLEET